ncbi:MAG: hypothetical protein JXC31_06390 [Acholeplasmataceae bacterium]|nr:hypothetical protein [Acholeplasmataceae bacterium]
MKIENKFLLINTFILFVLGLLFILIYATFVPLEPKDKLFGQVANLGEETIIVELPSIGHYEVLNSVSYAYDRQGNKIGTVYHVYARNGYIENPDDTYGYIELLVGINLENKVYVQIVDLRQTAVYNVKLQNYIYEYYQGFTFDHLVNIPAANMEDISAGATASRSTGTIKSLVSKAVAEYLNPTVSISEVSIG